MTDQFDPFKCQAVGPADECKRNSEKTWRYWSPLSHTAEKLKLGYVVAANKNQSPSVEVQAKYSTNHVRGDEQAEHAAESSAIQWIERNQGTIYRNVELNGTL